MDKLVQHIKMDIPGISKQDMYCYYEASFEANQAMQEPLEKLYKLENYPNMREKVKEYISELDKEIERCELILKNTSDLITESRLRTLVEVKNDLQGRLNELI